MNKKYIIAHIIQFVYIRSLTEAASTFKWPMRGVLVEKTLPKFQGELQVLLIKGLSHFMDILAWFKWQRCWIRFPNIACMNGGSLIRLHEMHIPAFNWHTKKIFAQSWQCMSMPAIHIEWPVLMKVSWTASACVWGCRGLCYSSLVWPLSSEQTCPFSFRWRDHIRINGADILPGQ